MRKCTEWKASQLGHNILLSEEDKRNVFIYLKNNCYRTIRTTILMFRRRSKDRALVSNVKSSNSVDQEKGNN
jgi:hypothetical protein